ncbi:MAG: hypothetical protein EA399_04575 [Desulfovibrionales bacterium]|nr:MAG: hypothetical protein EA399_04575 [Desulfovibrionales bacterium]
MHRFSFEKIFFPHFLEHKRVVCAILTFVFFFIVSLIVLNGRPVALAEPLFLADPAFTPRERPGVLFDHDGHMELADCLDCHHAFENGRNIWEYGMETQCSACHAAAEKGRLGLRRAVHGSASVAMPSSLPRAGLR